jgi:hypothetical protein
MDQDIVYINIDELVLWTENPRDPIDDKATDQDVVDKALLDENAKWTLKSLSKEMGDYYDFSELPTIVYKNEKPIVYDGNRRMVLAKIKHGLVSVGNYKIDVPDIPRRIPCNVCSEEVALKNILRKHTKTGTWDPLERDIFLHRYMNEPKTLFLLFEEDTNGFISTHPEMNQGFVKDELLNKGGFKTIGIEFDDAGNMFSLHNKEELQVILNDLYEKIRSKKITTRNNRGKIREVLDRRTLDILDKNKDNEYNQIAKLDNVNTVDKKQNQSNPSPRRTRRVSSAKPLLFGELLSLRPGDVNNLYRDICTIYEYYTSEEKKFSQSFISIIRMALRLLYETAAKEICPNLKGNKWMDDYKSKYYKIAKKTLSTDYKTFLSQQNVNEQTLNSLLHVGAHDYSATRIPETAVAVSIILGAMLTLSHGKV